jgi:hypothetical protein
MDHAVVWQLPLIGLYLPALGILLAEKRWATVRVPQLAVA